MTKPISGPLRRSFLHSSHAFHPDLVVTQLGVDTFYNDPLTKLNLSIHCFEKVIRRIKEIAPRWVALGGGGYDISNVARAWTLAWAVMNDVDLKEDLPESYLEKAARLGIYEKELRGEIIPLAMRSRRIFAGKQNGWLITSKRLFSRRYRYDFKGKVSQRIHIFKNDSALRVHKRLSPSRSEPFFLQRPIPGLSPCRISRVQRGFSL